MVGQFLQARHVLSTRCYFCEIDVVRSGLIIIQGWASPLLRLRVSKTTTTTRDDTWEYADAGEYLCFRSETGWRTYHDAGLAHWARGSVPIASAESQWRYFATTAADDQIIGMPPEAVQLALAADGYVLTTPPHCATLIVYASSCRTARGRLSARWSRTQATTKAVLREPRAQLGRETAR
jgi:hypothetical protein